MKINHELSLRQQQILTQSQIQTLTILAMDNIELETFLQVEYLENPMLDYRENFEKVSSSIEKDNYDQWSQKDHKLENIQNFLMEQLDLKSMDAEEERVKKYLINCIDDTGYFMLPLEDISQQCQIELEKVEEYLKDLAELEPVGVFSRTLKECLQKQLDSLGVTEHKLYQMIENHLEDIANGKIGNISRSLHIPIAKVRKYILLIESLNPRPFMLGNEEDAEFIVPDVIFKYDKKWEIELNDQWLGNYHMHDYYLKMMSDIEDTQLKRYFKEKAERVRFILQSIEQRRETLMKVCWIVLERQRDYLEGKGELKPLTMSKVAEKIEVHPSTVSRAVKGKYIQYPQGTILLKNLFTTSTVRDIEKKDMSADVIKNIIKKRILTEDGMKPYSDQQLVDFLKEKDIVVSRRAVAKYRKEMGFKSSYQRVRN